MTQFRLSSELILFSQVSVVVLFFHRGPFAVMTQLSWQSELQPSFDQSSEVFQAASWILSCKFPRSRMFTSRDLLVVVRPENVFLFAFSSIDTVSLRLPTFLSAKKKTHLYIPRKVVWPTFRDDFFPYADSNHTYWTGYFTYRLGLRVAAGRGSAGWGEASTCVPKKRIFKRSAALYH